MSDCSMLALILTVGTVRVLRSNCHSRHFFTPESSSRLSVKTQTDAVSVCFVSPERLELSTH